MYCFALQMRRIVEIRVFFDTIALQIEAFVSGMSFDVLRHQIIPLWLLFKGGFH